MYTSMKNVQILLSLLKEFGVKKVVHSPGGCNAAISRSIQSDPYFEEYSVVDERSAVFFALGLSMDSDEPVVVLCTSGTAVANYSSGMSEAFYKGVPLVAITADRSPYLLNQLETQKIDQTSIFRSVTKYEATLPVVHCVDDEWYCNRLVNEALLELAHHGVGPVHINVPTVGSNGAFSIEKLPRQRVISRIGHESNMQDWLQKRDRLLDCEKILVVMGENGHYSDGDLDVIEKFANIYNCTISIEHMSAYKGPHSLITYRATEAMTQDSFDEFIPDLVINVDGNIASVNLKNYLRANKGAYDHWSVRPDGRIEDVFMGLTDVFECSPTFFFRFFVDNAPSERRNDQKYYDRWSRAVEAICMPELPFSHLSIARDFSSKIPDGSQLELGILNSTRTLQYFDLDPSVRVSSNIGALGIDGSLSTLVGRAAESDRLCFIVQGDLSFFYDMNALTIRYVGSNLRILVVNNGGGGEFHIGIQSGEVEDLDSFITAAHHATAREWAMSQGFAYLSASNSDEFGQALNTFVGKSDSPILLEAFTDKASDAELLEHFYALNSNASARERAVGVVKKAAKTPLGQGLLKVAGKLSK